MNGQLAGWLEVDFDVRVTGTMSVDGGADREAKMWRVHDADGQTFPIKWTSGGTVRNSRSRAIIVDVGAEGRRCHRWVGQGPVAKVRRLGAGGSFVPMPRVTVGWIANEAVFVPLIFAGAAANVLVTCTTR